MITMPYTMPIHTKMMALFNITSSHTIYGLMKKKFKCKIVLHYDNYDDIIFDNDNDYNWFLLHL